MSTISIPTHVRTRCFKKSRASKNVLTATQCDHVYMLVLTLVCKFQCVCVHVCTRSYVRMSVRVCECVCILCNSVSCVTMYPVYQLHDTTVLCFRIHLHNALYTYTYIHKYIHMQVHKYIHTHTHYTHTHTHTMRTHILIVTTMLFVTITINDYKCHSATITHRVLLLSMYIHVAKQN